MGPTHCRATPALTNQPTRSAPARAPLPPNACLPCPCRRHTHALRPPCRGYTDAPAFRRQLAGPLGLPEEGCNPGFNRKMSSVASRISKISSELLILPLLGTDQQESRCLLSLVDTSCSMDARSALTNPLLGSCMESIPYLFLATPAFYLFLPTTAFRDRFWSRPCRKFSSASKRRFRNSCAARRDGRARRRVECRESEKQRKSGEVWGGAGAWGRAL